MRKRSPTTQSNGKTATAKASRQKAREIAVQRFRLVDDGIGKRPGGAAGFPIGAMAHQHGEEILPQAELDSFARGNAGIFGGEAKCSAERDQQQQTGDRRCETVDAGIVDHSAVQTMCEQPGLADQDEA